MNEDKIKANDLEKCPFCGSQAFFELGKRGSCQLHGEPFQSVVIRCKKHDCPAKPSVSAGDIFNGGEAKARLEAAKIWNKRILTIRPDVNQELVEALEGLLANPHTIYQRGLTQTTVYNPVENAYKTLAKHKAGDAGFAEDAIQPKYIAVEIYDREIRYDNKIIYTGDVKNLGNDRIEQIVADYKAANALRLRGE